LLAQYVIVADPPSAPPPAEPLPEHPASAIDTTAIAAAAATTFRFASTYDSFVSEGRSPARRPPHCGTRWVASSLEEI
jgi:hypothetical protein